MKIFKSKIVQGIALVSVAVASFMAVWSLTDRKQDKSNDPYRDKNIRKN